MPQGTEQRPDGWLYGTNQRTNKTGYIPAEFVEYVQARNPQQRPPPPPVPNVLEPVWENESDSEDAPPIPPRITDNHSHQQ